MKRFSLFLVICSILVFLLFSCVSSEEEASEVMEESVMETVDEAEEVEEVEMTKTGPFSHEEADLLQGPFAKPQEVTAACVACHEEEAHDFMQTVHWTWEGKAPNMQNKPDGVKIGKMTTINNFCIAVDSNWARCTQCHAGYGWKDNNYDFAKTENVDCLVCHDSSGTYKKDPKKAGMPFEDIDLAAAARSAADPSRRNCGFCHFFAGGGDNVKKGDLGTALINPDPSVDVHMGKLDFQCQTCHTAENHNIRGSSLHVAVSSGAVTCTECHTGSVHQNGMLNQHAETVACQTCHVPAFSRTQPTKMYWDWSTAGKKDAEGKNFQKKNDAGHLVYDSMKGTFTPGINVRPEYAWWNGNFNRMLVGDSYTKTPVDLASPIGNIGDKNSKIYPFKVMRGKQPADADRDVLIVPHLFPSSAGENAYWKKWNWEKAFEEGMAAAELDYSGRYEWVETYMYMGINHEVAPKGEALTCNDCHNGGIDFEALGYEGDPMMTGGR